MTDWTNQHGPIWKVNFAALYVVGITDPVLARQVLRCKHLDKTRMTYAFLDKVLSCMLATQNGLLHSSCRLEPHI